MATRALVVVADDFGIGLETSQGILDLAKEGLVTGSAFLVNTPFAEEALALWRGQGEPVELGWHPCLTLDRPVLPPHVVPSLVRDDGSFLPLASFLLRLARGRLVPLELEAELEAQLRRFREITGRAPAFVNAHHHLQLFAPLGEILLTLLARHRLRPYFRRVRETFGLLAAVSASRIKRAVLGTLGRRFARKQDRAGLPGNDFLAGLGEPWGSGAPAAFVRWLRATPGTVVELMCHPGGLDESLLGRDKMTGPRRLQQAAALRDPGFRDTLTAAGFVLMPASRIDREPRTLFLTTRGTSHAA
jgi:predicted glycoside hydrolase/deacetylase ChbG (UPF0249 family)